VPFFFFFFCRFPIWERNFWYSSFSVWFILFNNSIHFSLHSNFILF
jgi:hypothetical protein